ncbi:unnamed protein product [Adineta ricciae]|uniref:EGF-like domain-containing protein n=1 Tax=Adineta ricciae TaxID=249248 RepID=A0A815GT81_ADIRI|nr:unnamed protein product [Adineta ricciae]CAF1562024.1 unnamed protein product [Adineta ricciae]
MKFIQLFIVFFIYFKCNSRYWFYETINDEETFDCLYAHLQYSYLIENGAYLTLYHLIPFCQRLDEKEKLIFISDENVQNKISFQKLSTNGITSSQLLNWFIPIDIVEDYEINGEHSEKFIYNCSSFWFGSTCQYQLIHDQQVSFGKLVRLTFLHYESPSLDLDFPVGTCYPFLKSCIRGPSPMCLDWREICNGVYDCVHGEDEQFCHLLEENHCSEDEFQCLRSKECISQTFANDYEESFDCLDTTDETEQWRIETGELCMTFPTFECEEVTYGYPNYFVCGDGQILQFNVPTFDSFCENRRDQYMTIILFTSFDYISTVACRQRLLCFIRPDRIDFLSDLHNEIHCDLPVDHCPLEWLVFPQYPMLYSYFQFIYLTNRSLSLSKTDLTPDYICFNASRCPTYLFCSVDIGINNSLHCCHALNITRYKIEQWFSFQIIFLNIFRNCFQTNRNEKFLLTNETNNSSLKWINSHKTFPFAHFCNGFRYIPDDNETKDSDETDCHLWPCDNPNTRCDRFIHCFNGIDEVNCSYNLCSFNELFCEKVRPSISYCLPISYLADDYTQFSSKKHFRVIHLINETIGDAKNYLFWNQSKCLTVEYSNQSNLPLLKGNNDDVCLIPKLPMYYVPNSFIIMRNTKTLCISGVTIAQNIRNQQPYLRSSHLGDFPSVIPQISPQSTEIQIKQQQILNNVDIEGSVSWFCNRGFAIFYENNPTMKCLCPPSYFGLQCQWQNQRVSLTIQLKYFTFTYEMPIFQLILMLIDDEGQISPYHEQIIHLPKRDCGTKYHLNLLYPSRPKNSSANSSVRIDIFNRITLTYWASWLLPIPFPFLPVNRISKRLLIPLNPQQTEFSCSLSCENRGKCLRYVNTNSSYFCQCKSGYSGLNCQLKSNCSCSSDSFCLHSSICICPLYKFGPKCYLKHEICQSLRNPCENDGQCIPIDDRVALNNFICICKEGFVGERCENIQNRIDIQFNDETTSTDLSFLVHLITIHQGSDHVQSTMLKQIKYGQNQVTIFTTIPFHLVFVESLQEDFYLVIKRENFIKSEHIQTKLFPKYRCIFINELLDKTLKSVHYLRRVKSYPLLCRQNKHVMCFYDELYMCICDEDRFSNCFVFNRNTTYNCGQRENPCENKGKCFLANQTCSSSMKCLCSGCFYGTKCQFTTEGFVLSLDYILSYHIKPNLSFSQQPFIVKMSVAIVTMMFLMGFLGGFLTVVTFRVEKIRTNGCGFYLFVSGWISILISSVLVNKFVQLILLQMKIFTNFSFLRFNCILLDVLIKVFLAINDWLDGCISIERVVTVKQGLTFNKSKSKQMAKWVTSFVILFSISTHLHDPFHRQLIKDIDIDEERFWCISRYSSSINTYNSFVTLFHFLPPFSINFISTIIIIITVARNRSTIQSRLTYVEHLKLQLKEHKHHLIASFALVLLGLPRLIISFVSGCMKSPNNSWLFLFGYLLSFFPSMITFIVYVLPSRTYKDEFTSIIQRNLRRLRS